MRALLISPRSWYLSAGLALSLLIGGPQQADAQITALPHYSYNTWSLAEGLPQITVNAINRDTDGRVWIATENGLARFDGSTMEVFNTANTPALQSNWIKTLLRDSQGRLWISTLKNLVLFDGKQFSDIADLAGTTSMAEDARGTLWLGGDALWTLQGQTLSQFSSWQGEIRALLAQGNRIYLADRSAQITLIDGSDYSKLRLPYAEGQILVNDLAWHDNTLWVATDRGLFYWQTDNRSFRLFSLPASDSDLDLAPVKSLASDGDNTLWLIHHNRIVQLVGRQLHSLLPGDAANALPALRGIFVDRDRSIWVGSLTAGLRHYWPAQVEQLDHRQGLTEAYTWSFWPSPKGVLVGTNAGVFRYSDGRFRQHVPASWLPGGVAYSLLEDQSGRLWVGTRQGLISVNPGGQTTESYPQLHGLQVNGILQASDGQIYFGTAKGVFAWHQGVIIPRFQKDLGASAVRYLLEDREQRIWVGTETGLWQQTAQGLARADHPELAETFVTSMTELDDGRRLVASYQDGLFVQHKGQWHQLTQDHGLPSPGVNYVGQAGNGLWALFSDGIYRIDLASLTAAVLGQSPLRPQMVLHDTGLQQGRSRIRCCNGAGNGKGQLIGNWLWAPTLSGVVRMNVQAPLAPPPQARIHRLVNGNTAFSPKQLAHIPAALRDLEIGYSAVDFRHADSLRYRYRLRPYQTDWVEADDRLTAFYTNVPPGKFTFEVQASYRLGSWGEIDSLTIYVEKKYYETLWFKLLAGALLLLAVYLAMRWRTHRLQQLQRRLQREVAERTQALEEANAQLAQLNQHLQETSVTDELTGLRNRRFIQQQIPGLMARLRRLRSNKGDEWITGILLIDLDHFKKVNDKYGHNMGDRVLQCTAKHLAKTIRTEDYLLRWGGEEFLLVVPDIHCSKLADVAERVRKATREATKDLAIAEPLSASVGVVRHPLVPEDQPLENWQASVAAADFALYAAKSAGRNRCAHLAFNPQAHFPLNQSVSSEALEAWQAQGHIQVTMLTKTDT